MILYSKKIVMEDGVKSGYLYVEENKIVDFKEKINHGNYINLEDNIIMPGIIDTHNHGGFGVRVNDGCTKQEMQIYLKGLVAQGVTAVFPTTYELGGIELSAEFAKNPISNGAQVLGINSEGPWGARVGEKGVNTGYPNVDLAYARQMIEKSNGHLKVLCIAPEIPNANNAIQYFKSQGVKLAIYHTNATYEQTCQGIRNGIEIATHLGNVMTGLHHRDIGAFGACLLDDSLFCEVICDGMHICNEMLKIILKIKNYDKIMMVSDNVQYAGLPAGFYRRAGVSKESDRNIIEVKEDGRVLSKSGRLSGSGKPVLFGMKNLVENLNLPLEIVSRFASYNPAKKYNLKGKGSIKKGNDADFIVIDDNFNVLQTYVLGEKVFDSNINLLQVNTDFIKTYKIDQ